MSYWEPGRCPTGTYGGLLPLRARPYSASPAGASVYSRPSSHCLVLHRRMPCQLARSLVRLHAPGANLGQTNGSSSYFEFANKVRLSQSRTLVSPASRARGKRTGSSKYAFDKVGTPDSSMPACGTTHACSYEAAVLAGGKTQRSRRCLSEVRRRGVHSTRVLTGGGRGGGLQAQKPTTNTRKTRA
jgi:hypothetical protein